MVIDDKYNPYNHVRIIDVCAPMPKYMGMYCVGTLSKTEDTYRFVYLRPEGTPQRFLPGLRTWANETLDLYKWPFFSTRIPKLTRADVMKFAIETHLDTTNPMTLLAVFGAVVIQNPYVLVSKITGV